MEARWWTVEVRRVAGAEMALRGAEYTMTDPSSHVVPGFGNGRAASYTTLCGEPVVHVQHLVRSPARSRHPHCASCEELLAGPPHLLAEAILGATRRQ